MCMLVKEDWSCFIVLQEFLLFLSTYQLQAQADWSVIAFMDNVNCVNLSAIPTDFAIITSDSTFL